MAVKAEAKGDLKKILAAAAKKNLLIGPFGTIAKDIKSISTGNIAIDYAIGVGGLPLGRSVELFGNPSCGKTTTALQTAVVLQQIIKAGGDPERGISADDIILFLDYEHALDPEYCRSLGLDIEHESFMIAQPDTAEEGVNVAVALIETGLVRLFIIDSIAAMMPEAKADADLGKSLPAIQAKFVTDMTQKLNPILNNYNCTAIYLNHLKELMDMGGRRPGMPARTDTPGGKALKYFSSVRIEYTKIKDNTEKIIDPLTKVEMTVSTSTDVRVKVVKNKVAAPFKQAQVRVRYGKGFDNLHTALLVLVAHKKIVVEASGYYYFHNLSDLGLTPDWMERSKKGTFRPYIQGTKNIFALADEHPEWRAGLIAEAERISREDGSGLDKVVPIGEAEEDEDEAPEENGRADMI